MSWEYIPALTISEPPGVDQGVAPEIMPGVNWSGSYLYPGLRNVALKTTLEEQETYEGWYKFTALRDGMVLIRAFSANSAQSISLWEGGTLVAARWNSIGMVQMMADVEKGHTYGLRITSYFTTLTSLSITKVAAVVHGYAPFTSIIAFPDTANYTTDAAGNTVSMASLVAGPTVEEAALFSFGLGGIDIPEGADVNDSNYPMFADCRIVMDTSDTAPPYNNGWAFCFYSTVFSGTAFYHTMSHWYQNTTRGQDYISLHNADGSWILTLDQVLNGTIPGPYDLYPGDHLQMARWQFLEPSSGSAMYVGPTESYLRASWFAVDEGAMVRRYPLDNGRELSTSRRSYPPSNDRRLVGGFH